MKVSQITSKLVLLLPVLFVWLQAAFGQTTGRGNNAAFVSQNIPAVMTAGQSYRVLIVFKNSGLMPWIQASDYRLGSQSPQDNTTWGTARVALPMPVVMPTLPGLVGAAAAFDFTVRAPQTPGMYSFHWRMVRDGAEWFGESTPRLDIQVKPASPPPPPGQPGGPADTIYVPAPPNPLGGDYTTGYTYTKQPNSSVKPLWGFADTHVHLMSHLAFGKKAFFGEPDGPMSWALRDCAGYHGPGGIGWFGKGGSLFLGLFEGGFGHYTGGYPNFDGWPRYTSKIHQQVYIDWLRRAFDGGLRLMVSLAVQNGLLSREFGGSGYNDAGAIDEQIQAMKDYAARHGDWMEIAYTPADARRIIGQNKLAIVLGVEVDSLGTPSVEYGRNEVPDIVTHLRQMYDKGVRHIFPVHLANNNLAGAAVYGTPFNVLNWHLRGDYYNVKTAPAGVHFRLDQRTEDDGIIANFYWFSGFHPPDYSRVPGAHANALGLTAAGKDAITRMMRLGMIVDTDHLSDAAFESVLTMAENWRYPLVGGHMAMRELGLSPAETSDIHKFANEYGRTGLQLRRLAALGGIIGVGMNQTELRTFSSANGLTNNAHNTSKSFAQAYLYALSQTRGTGIAIGSDFNGLPGSLGPRFGPAALPGYDDSDEGKRQRRSHAFAQRQGVRYDAPLRYVATARWNPGDTITDEQKDVFQAIALAQSGHNIDRFDLSQVPPKVRSGGSQIWIRNVAKGMRADRLSALPEPNFWDEVFNYNSARVQRAAFYAKTLSNPASIPDAEMRRIYGQIRSVWEMYSAMNGPNPPLTRSVAGNRDFDINVDGVAHMGMLPDLLQDLKNTGVTSQQLAPLFRSAEDYIAMWEAINARRGSIPLPQI